MKLTELRRAANALEARDNAVALRESVASGENSISVELNDWRTIDLTNGDIAEVRGVVERRATREIEEAEATLKALGVEIDEDAKEAEDEAKEAA